MKKFLGYLLIVGGVFDIIVSFVGKTSWFGVLIGLAFVALGWKLKDAPDKLPASLETAPPVPAGFTPSFWHKNIAIDAGTKDLWVRDETGAACVLKPHEVLGWSLESKESSKSFAGGNMVVHNAVTMHAYSKLCIKTADLAKPVWKVKFDAHTDHLASGGNANYRELQEWSDRLNAFYHQN